MEITDNGFKNIYIWFGGFFLELLMFLDQLLCFSSKNMHCLFQNICLPRWKKNLTILRQWDCICKISFDPRVWDKYRWWDPFFHFPPFKRETGFHIANTSLPLLYTLWLIGSKSCIVTKLTILPQWWSYFNELLFKHSYLARN